MAGNEATLDEAALRSTHDFSLATAIRQRNVRKARSDSEVPMKNSTGN